MTDLPITYRGTIYPWHCDHLNHMNVMWYVSKFDEATWQFFLLFGITPSWLRTNSRGLVAVDQHVSYKRELVAGDLVTVRSGLLEIRNKVIRFFHQMHNAETGELCAVMVLTAVHTDTNTRKSVPFTEEIVSRAQSLLTDCDPGI